MSLYDQKTTSEFIADVGDGLGLGRTITASSSDETRIVGWLNDMQRIIARSHMWRSLRRTDSSILTIPGQSFYPLPPDVRRIYNMRLIDDTCIRLAKCSSGWTSADAGATVTFDANYRHGETASLKLAIASNPSDGASGIMVYSALQSGIITSFADATEGRTTVTSASHGLANGDAVTIENSTAYDGVYTAQNVATNTFTIAKTYTAETPAADTNWARNTRDLSGYTNAAIGFWVYSTKALATNSLDIVITSAASGAETGTEGTDYVSPVVATAIPAYKWTYIKVTGVDLTAIDDFASVGIKANSDLYGSTAFSIYFDSIHLYNQSYQGQNWPIKILNASQLDDRVPNSRYINSNRPVVAVVYGDNNQVDGFELFPVPDASYPIWIRYSAYPRKFVAPATSDVISDLNGVDEVLVSGAVWRGLVNQRAWESANQMEGAFRRMLSEAKRDDEMSDGWQPELGAYCGIGADFSIDTIDIPAESASSTRGSSAGFFYLY